MMLLISCSDDVSSCAEIPTDVPIYDSVAKCDADMPRLMVRYSVAPLVLGKCISIDPALHDKSAEIIWDVAVDGTLVAEILELSGGPIMVADAGKQ